MKSIEMGKLYHCDEAGAACCGRNDSDCRCNIMETLYYENQGKACKFAADHCCYASQIHSAHIFANQFKTYHSCKCNLFGYLKFALDFDIENMTVFDSCILVETFGITESLALKGIYYTTGGNYWVNNIGWYDEETHHCEWFGISCNENEGVTVIDLENNNLTGLFPSLSISKL